MRSGFDGGDGDSAQSRRRVAPTLIAIGVACAAAQARADEPEVDPFSLAPEQLFDATVMLVSRQAEPLRNAPAAIFVITAEDIARAGATSIPEALRLAPGVDVAQTGASGFAVSARGFNDGLANKLLVMIDSREIYDPLFSGVYWDVQDLVLEDIDRIEVVRGPGGTMWGANAVNGVINIITKEAAATQGALLSVVEGERERALSARFGGGGDTKARWRVFARRLERDGATTRTGGDANDSLDAWRGGFRLDADPGARDALTLQGEYYRSESGLVRLVPSLTPPYAAIGPHDIEATGGHVLARWRRETGPDAKLTVQAYADFTRRDQFILVDQRQTFDIDAQYMRQAGRHGLVAGVAYRNTLDQATDTATFQAEDLALREERVSAFAQDHIGLDADGRWFLTLGTKFEHDENVGSGWQPGARLQWLGETQMAWAAVSRALRMPSELERGYTVLLGVAPPPPVPIAVPLTPSPELEAETMVAYEAGYRRQLSTGAEMDLSAFYNTYDDLAANVVLAPYIVATPPAHFVLPIQVQNGSEARAWGMEALVNWRPRADLELTASYSMLDLDISGPSDRTAIDAQVAEGKSPRLQSRVSAHWAATTRLALDSTVYYVDSLKSANIDSYVRADMRLSVKLTSNASLDLVGRNLFDDSHIEFGDGAQVERSALARLVWRR